MIRRVKQSLMSWWERLRQTRPIRAWMRYLDLRGNRLAGTVSFYGFLSLFPLILLGASIASVVASADGVRAVQDVVDDNFPGLGLDVSTFHRRAGTLGLISAATLLFTGLGWVDATRACVRSMWGLDDEPGNLVTRKGLDLVALVGLGILIAVSWGVSVAVGGLAEQLFEALDLEGSLLAKVVLWAIGLVLSVGASAVLFGYLLSGLPRIRIPIRELVLASVLGAVVFELLKLALLRFIVGTASHNAYAAFAAPLALLTWIYLVTRVLMFLAALAAEGHNTSAAPTTAAQPRDA